MLKDVEFGIRVSVTIKVDWGEEDRLSTGVKRPVVDRREEGRLRTKNYTERIYARS